eukprot:352367-Chlamydomonas_euryale.AAC.7
MNTRDADGEGKSAGAARGLGRCDGGTPSSSRPSGCGRSGRCERCGGGEEKSPGAGVAGPGGSKAGCSKPDPRARVLQGPLWAPLGPP